VKAAEGETTSLEESFDEICDVVASEIVQVIYFHSLLLLLFLFFSLIARFTLYT
jgi:hypothetical protein